MVRRQRMFDCTEQINNSPIINVTSATIFSFQGSSDEALAGSKCPLDELQTPDVEKNCFNWRNSTRLLLSY